MFGANYIYHKFVVDTFQVSFSHKSSIMEGDQYIVCSQLCIIGNGSRFERGNGQSMRCPRKRWHHRCHLDAAVSAHTGEHEERSSDWPH